MPQLFIPHKHFLTLILIFVVGFSFLLYQEHNFNQAANVNGECLETGKTIEVSIKDNTFLPSNIHAKKCDRLVIVNNDNQKRSPAFGEHDQHTDYRGFKQVILSKNQTTDIHLISTGTYHLHDDFYGVATATIVVE
jgi:hypothetical protein